MQNQEKEILQWLKENRQDQIEIMKIGEEEWEKMIQMKKGTFEGEIEYLNNLIKTLERWMDDEQAFRVKNEDDLRAWFDQKVDSLTEKVKTEEKMALDRERKIVEQF